METIWLLHYANWTRFIVYHFACYICLYPNLIILKIGPPGKVMERVASPFAIELWRQFTLKEWFIFIDSLSIFCRVSLLGRKEVCKFWNCFLCFQVNCNAEFDSTFFLYCCFYNDVIFLKHNTTKIVLLKYNCPLSKVEGIKRVINIIL